MFHFITQILSYFSLDISFSWRKKWQPTPVFLPGKFNGWKSLVGYCPWGHKESDTTEWLHFLTFYSSFWRRKWQPTPGFLPGESHGWRGLVGYSLWGCKEPDMTKQLIHTHTHKFWESRVDKTYKWRKGTFAFRIFFPNRFLGLNLITSA